jgi:diguanylate cyclase (GGDEF)-like protein/PAS domain S-box-containing protein
MTGPRKRKAKPPAKNPPRLRRIPFVKTDGGVILRGTTTEADRIRKRLDTLYATIPIGLIYVTRKLVVERASPLIAAIHGRPVEEQIKRRLPDCIKPERWAKLKPIYQKVLQTGSSFFGEEELPDPRVPGRTLHFMFVYYADKNDDGTIRGVQGIIQDVTVMKETHREQERQIRELEAENQKLDQLAIRDPLTGLYNRRFFDESLNREWQRFQRSGEAFTVTIMDVDAFKSINDQHGHETGDQALQQVGTALRATLRVSDLVARVGGDEFAALLPGTDIEHSKPVIEKLQEAVTRLRLDTAEGSIPISLSLGAAAVPGIPPVASAAELLRVADKRMYEAKRLRSSGLPGQADFG